LLRSAGFAEQAAGAGMGARKLEAPIREVELVLRGFGKGREAVTKALLGSEGRFLREKITSVSDDTKLKFGGTRSQNPRRLG
jgi:small subunit ribosomal protein S11